MKPFTSKSVTIAMGTRNKEQRAKTLYYRLAHYRRNKIVFCLLSFVFVLCSCKTQRVAPIILKDSVSITYKQGTVQPLSIYKTEEQPSPLGLRGAQTAFRKNSMVSPSNGETVSREGAKVFEGLLSQRTNKKAVPPTTIRVDTVFIERWHTQTVPTPPPRGESVGATKFYKDCTKGFWVLLILLLGGFALRIMRAIYLRK